MPLTPLLYDQLIACVVKITIHNSGAEGSGFLVAPGKVLTCTHVLNDKDGKVRNAAVHYRDQSYDVVSVTSDASDLSLLDLNISDHPCVLLDEHCRPHDSLFFYGYPGQQRGWRAEGGSAQCDGPVTDLVDGQRSNYVKFTPGGVRPGMSGCPLLNEATGAVCGVVKRTRNSDIDQGGLAVPVTEVWRAFPQLRSTHDDYHRLHPEWRAGYQATSAALAKSFQQAPQALAQRIPVTDFQTLINTRSAEFVGRDFVFRKIDAVLDDPAKRSGYILITAEPGFGKTAVSAYLAKTRGYVHHFNVTGLDIRSPKQFVENITAQITIKYRIPASVPPASVADYGRYLDSVFRETAAANPGARIVVLVDALDEATDDSLPQGANKLFLPPMLPDGVYVLATSRPAVRYRLVASPLTLIELKDGDADNRHDILEFIDRFLNRFGERMESALKGWGIERDEFTRVVAEHSAGNFMYLKHVLADIRDGRLNEESLDDVFQLPVGIGEYYNWHWNRAQLSDPTGFESTTKPVVCMLATAKEPVSVEQVVRWTRKHFPILTIDRIQNVVVDWRQFLDEYRPPRSAPLYRIYHLSFQEFLRDVVGLGLYHDLIIESAFEKVPSYRG